jgi:uncharacterized protein YjiS (DUF1127 family)
LPRLSATWRANASTAEATGSLSLLWRFIRNWRARRAVVRLDALDDYLLHDIGVPRAEVRWASGLPLTVNAALELEGRATRRRRGR